MGIGTAICRELGREGCDVAFTYRKHAPEAQALVEDLEGMGSKALALRSDVADHDATMQLMEALVSQWGGLDILVCNAGINWDGVIWKMTEQQWDQVINVNLKGYFNFNKAAASVFKDQRYGKIVNISSINGLRGKFAQTNYAASKGGEISFSKSLARELGKFNVTVNVVAPGMVMTDMARKIPAEFLNKALEETLVGRIGDPEDVAHLVAFLCSDRSRHITGEVITIDGGQYL